MRIFEYNHSSSEILDNSTESPIADYNLHLQEYVIYFRCVWFCVFMLGAATLLYGVVSWIVIPKWRQFRNYVFLNILLSGSICLCLCFTLKVSLHIITFFHLVFNHWSIVAIVMFYMDLVKIFNKIEHRFLKATIFGWTMPALLQLLRFITGIRLAYFTAVESSLLFILYLRVLHALCTPNLEGTSRKKITMIVLKCTLGFILSGFVLYFSSLFMFMFKPEQKKDKGASYAFVTVIAVAVLFVNIVFLMNKMNCKLWIEYISHKQSSGI